MDFDSPTAEYNHLRSIFVRRLVQCFYNPAAASSTSIVSRKIIKKIVQFWDNFDLLIKDICECIETWK